LVTLFLLAPFALYVINPWLPARILVATNLAVAVLVAYTARSLNPRLTFAAVAILVAVHSAHISQLFFSDTMVRKADQLMANRIQTTLQWRYPDFDPAKTPVYFHGGLRVGNTHKQLHSDVFGSSFFLWDGGS